MGIALQGGLGPPGSSVLSRAWSGDQSEDLTSIASPNPRRAHRLRAGSNYFWCWHGPGSLLCTATWGKAGFAEGKTDLERVKLKSSYQATKWPKTVTPLPPGQDKACCPRSSGAGGQAHPHPSGNLEAGARRN